jgi:hypothetical protein
VSASSGLRVLGTAFFAPCYESTAHAFENRAREPAAPPFAIVTGRLRRFTSLSTQLHLEVAGTALAAAGVDPKDVRCVFSSALGELDTAVALLTGLADDGAPSPARFAQSIHSAAAGLFSLAVSNRHASETISAGRDTFSAALEEAFFIAEESRAPVLLTCADDAAPAVLGSRAPGLALAASFVLSANSEKSVPRIALESVPLASAPPPITIPAHFHGSAVLPAMLLIDAIASAKPGSTRELRIDGNEGARPVVVRVSGS